MSNIINKFAQFFTALGQTSINAGMTSAMIRSQNNMNRYGSIFGGCCGGRYYSQGNINQFGNFGFGNYGGFGGSCLGWSGQQWLAQMGLNMSAEQGLMDGIAIRQQAEAQAKARAAQQQGKASPLAKQKDWLAADKIDSNQDKTAGEKLDQNTTQILKDKKGGTTIVSGLTKDDKAGNTEKYKTQVSELAKSYGASMDTNGDGYVSLDEYIAKENYKGAQIAFNKIDINGDGKLDWKELGSMLSTIDKDSSGTKDGVITYSELDKWQQLMVDETDNTFDKEIRKSYNLFGIEKKDSTQKTD